MLDLRKVATSEEDDEAGVVDLELLCAQLQDLVHLPLDPGRHRQAAGCLIPAYGKEGDDARTCGWGVGGQADPSSSTSSWVGKH